MSATSPDSTPAQASVIEVGGSAPVYKAVTIACCGAFLFGYHLGVLNGPLQELAADLNFAGNVTLQGLVRGRNCLPHQPCRMRHAGTCDWLCAELL